MSVHMTKRRKKCTMQIHKTTNALLINKALISAVEKGHDKCVESLLQAGADVNTADESREPLLNLAVRLNFHRCLKLLIQAGADVKASNAFGYTLLMDAALRGHTKCVSLLVEAGADVNAANKSGRTALTHATWKGHTDCVDVLIKAGADVNAADDNGDTILMTTACYSKSIQCVKRLLIAGAYINKINKNGHNALQNYIAEYHTIDENIAMLLYAAGEILVVASQSGINVVTRISVPLYLQHGELNLKHTCRETIRKHLINLNPHLHLFDRVPRLGLPKSLTEYLLYERSLYLDYNDDGVIDMLDDNLTGLHIQ